MKGKAEQDFWDRWNRDLFNEFQARVFGKDKVRSVITRIESLQGAGNQKAEAALLDHR